MDKKKLIILGSKSSEPTPPNNSTITLEQGGEVKGSFTLNQDTDQTIELDKGGESWYGSQAQFNALGEYDDDTDYFISDKIDYNTDIIGKPNLSIYATKTYVDTANGQQDVVIAGKMSAQFMTKQEFDDLGNNIPEGQNIFVQGDTIEVVVTFTDQSTATYNVVID